MLNNATIIAVKHVLVLLEKGELTKKQLAERTGLSRGAIQCWLDIFHIRPNNLVYISGWRPPAGKGIYTAKWRFGYTMADEPKPTRLTAAEKYKRYKNKYNSAIQTKKLETKLIHKIK